MGDARPLKLLNIATWLISTCLCLRPFCLCLGDRALSPSTFTPCVYMQRQRQELENKQWKEKMQRVYERSIKKISMIDMASKETRKQANKREGKQKVVSARDECRFGLNVQNFIVLKYGQHTSKQDSCMDM